MILMYMMISLSMSFLLIFLKHPLSMGFLLFIQTILISLTLGFFNLNYWFSYILFLIMIGGMLILFIYMTSMASNEMFKYSNYLIIMMMMMLMLYIMFNFIDPMMWNFNNMNQNSLMNFNFNLSLNKYLNFPFNLISLMIMIYLLITLIAVVKITNIKKGPLRQSNN